MFLPDEVFVVVGAEKFAGMQLQLPGEEENVVAYYSLQNGRFMYLIPEAEPEVTDVVKFTTADRGDITIRALQDDDKSWLIADGWSFDGDAHALGEWAKWSAGIRTRKPDVVATWEGI